MESYPLTIHEVRENRIAADILNTTGLERICYYEKSNY